MDVCSQKCSGQGDYLSKTYYLPCTASCAPPALQPLSWVRGSFAQLIKVNSDSTLAYVSLKQTPFHNLIICCYQSLRNQGVCTLIKAGRFFSLFKLAGSDSISCKNFFGWAPSSFGTLLQNIGFFWVSAKMSVYLLSWTSSAFVRFHHCVETQRTRVKNVWSVGQRCSYHEGRGKELKKPLQSNKWIQENVYITAL